MPSLIELHVELAGELVCLAVVERDRQIVGVNRLDLAFGFGSECGAGHQKCYANGADQVAHLDPLFAICPPLAEVSPEPWRRP